jgi:hypothetical protein
MWNEKLVKQNQKVTVKSAKNFEIQLKELLDVFRVLGEANQNLREITKVMEIMDFSSEDNLFPVEIKIPLEFSVSLVMKIQEVSVHLKPSK